MTQPNPTQVDISPCPFCGASLVPNNNLADLYVKRYGTHYIHPDTDCYMADWEVSPSGVEGWNRRAALSAPVAAGGADLANNPRWAHIAHLVPPVSMANGEAVPSEPSPADCGICKGNPRFCDYHDCGNAHRSTHQPPAPKSDAIARAISVFEDVLTDIADWEDKALSEAVEKAKAGLLSLSSKSDAGVSVLRKGARTITAGDGLPYMTLRFDTLKDVYAANAELNTILSTTKETK